MIKRLLRDMVEWPWRLMPTALRTALLKAGVFAAARQPARPALLELLELERVVSGQIDLAALEYGDGVHVKHRLMRYHDFFVNRIDPGDAGARRRLRLRCGRQFDCRTRPRAQVTGIDLSATNVAQARASYTTAGLAFVHGEAPRDLKDEHFDVIVLSNVLEHVEGAPGVPGGARRQGHAVAAADPRADVRSRVARAAAAGARSLSLLRSDTLHRIHARDASSGRWPRPASSSRTCR